MAASNDDNPQRAVQCYMSRTMVCDLSLAAAALRVQYTLGPLQDKYVGVVSQNFALAAGNQAIARALIERGQIANRIQNMSTRGKIKWGENGRN
jgi:hypothetical protein